jgi:DNA-binding NtrC family response regulator
VGRQSEWKRAGGRLHTLQGLVVVEAPSRASSQADPEAFAESIWRDSYEAEQHLLHLGQADQPVCWTLAGFASGYLSFCNGREICCIEQRCRGQGDAVCTIVGRAREDWGEAVSAHLPFYEKACLDEVLLRATGELRRVERRLRARRKELGPDAPAEAAGGLIALSEGMQRAIDLARRVAKVDSTVLITGESGVGKERLAQLHNRAVDVRVLAATNRDLPAEVHAARFRQDLYYRLRVVEIRVPPLRERRDDILALARAFLRQATGRIGRKITSFSPAAANQLVRYGWPGNVRELENAIERAVVLARGSRVDVDDLPEEIGRAVPSAHAPGDVRPLDEVERDYILAVVRANQGNNARAAEQLKIGTATLYRKLKRYEAG